MSNSPTFIQPIVIKKLLEENGPDGKKVFKSRLHQIQLNEVQDAREWNLTKEQQDAGLGPITILYIKGENGRKINIYILESFENYSKRTGAIKMLNNSTKSPKKDVNSKI